MQPTGQKPLLYQHVPRTLSSAETLPSDARPASFLNLTVVDSGPITAQLMYRETNIQWVFGQNT